MRILTYNVHSGVGTDGKRCLARIAQAIAASDADVIALQELDHRRVRSQHVHQARELARQLTMHYHFHPALRLATEEYGDAILSKHPLRLIKAGALPTVASGLFLESRGALWVEVFIRGVAWQVINTHFGLGRMERLLQATALLGPEWVGSASTRSPLIVCGDFNSQAGGRVHRLLSANLRDVQLHSRRNTFPSRLPVLSIDHVFVSADVRVLAVDVPRNPLTRLASDHLPLFAELALQ